jgi:hypothetical protein
MSSVSEEIQQLQKRILELETNEKEKDKKDKEESISHNFQVINSILTKKKDNISKNNYNKSVQLARYYDEQLVTRLDAVYNILQILDKRLEKLEATKNESF